MFKVNNLLRVQTITGYRALALHFTKKKLFFHTMVVVPSDQVLLYFL